MECTGLKSFKIVFGHHFWAVEKFPKNLQYFLTLSQLIIKQNKENVINKFQRIIKNVCLAL